MAQGHRPVPQLVWSDLRRSYVAAGDHQGPATVSTDEQRSHQGSGHQANPSTVIVVGSERPWDTSTQRSGPCRDCVSCPAGNWYCLGCNRSGLRPPRRDASPSAPKWIGLARKKRLRRRMGDRAVQIK